MKNVFAIISILMLTIFSSMGQNCVVDELSVPFVDIIGLSPKHSVEENYHKIDSVISLHKEKIYNTYYIKFYGLYESKVMRSWYIRYSGKEEFYPVMEIYLGCILSDFSIKNCKITEILTQLYTYSIDEPFKVPMYFQYYQHIKTSFKDEKETNGCVEVIGWDSVPRDVIDRNKVKFNVVRFFKLNQDYVRWYHLSNYQPQEDYFCTIYCLSSESPLYQKIKEKVIGVTNINSDCVREIKANQNKQTKKHKDEITDGIYFKKS